jgi:hypothetical protein
MKILFNILLIITFVNSANLTNDVRTCSKIQDNAKRLKCYDNIIKNYNLNIEQNTMITSGKNQWSVSEKIDPMTDKKIIYLSNRTKTAKGTFGGNIYLIARCKEGKSPELYINWASYLGSKAIITSRFDKKKSKIMEWNISTDSEASFYP